MQNDTILQKVLAHLRNHLSAKLIANLLKFEEHFFLRKKETLFFFKYEAFDEKANPFGKLQRSVILLTRKEEMRSSCF
jgi:hypothetical protein